MRKKEGFTNGCGYIGDGEEINLDVLHHQFNNKYQTEQAKRQHPTQQEIKNSITLLKQKFPSLNLQATIKILYKRLIISTKEQKKYKPQSKKHQNVCKVIDVTVENDPNKPKFQIRQIAPKTKWKSNNKQEDRDWLREKPEDPLDQKLNSQIWERFNRPKQDRTDKNSTTSKIYKQSNEDNFRVTEGWKFTTQNKSHRLYCNKVAPKFNSKDQEMKFYQKRLAAKAFCDRGYELAQVKQEYFQLAYKSYYATPDAPINRESFPSLGQLKPYKSKGSAYPYPDPKRYKVISTAFIADTLRRLQIFIMEKVDRRIRPFTGPQIRAIFSILLNAQHYIPQQEYITFRRFVKFTFDLGSATIYQNPSMSLYRSIQIILKDRLSQGRLDNQSMTSEHYPPQWKNIENQNISAQEESVIGIVDIDQQDLNGNFQHRQLDFQQNKHF